MPISGLIADGVPATKKELPIIVVEKKKDTQGKEEAKQPSHHSKTLNNLATLTPSKVLNKKKSKDESSYINEFHPILDEDPSLRKANGMNNFKYDFPMPKPMNSRFWEKLYKLPNFGKRKMKISPDSSWKVG